MNVVTCRVDFQVVMEITVVIHEKELHLQVARENGI